MFILGILLVYIIGADDVAKSVPVTTVRIISPVIVNVRNVFKVS